MAKFRYRLKYGHFRSMTSPGVKIFSPDEIYQLVAGVDSDNDIDANKFITVVLKDYNHPNMQEITHQIWSGYLEKVELPFDQLEGR